MVGASNYDVSISGKVVAGEVSGKSSAIQLQMVGNIFLDGAYLLFCHSSR